MLGPDGDLISGRPHHLPVFPLLLVGDQSSLDEDVVQEDVDDDVVPGVDFSRHFSAASDDVLRVEWQTIFAAGARGLSPFLCDQFLPLAHAEEVFLDFPDHLHGFWCAI